MWNKSEQYNLYLYTSTFHHVGNYLAYCISSRWWMMISLKRLVEKLVGETEVLGGNLSQCHFVHHKSHNTWPGLVPGRPRWKNRDYRPSYNTASLEYLSHDLKTAFISSCKIFWCGMHLSTEHDFWEEEFWEHQILLVTHFPSDSSINNMRLARSHYTARWSISVSTLYWPTSSLCYIRQT
jgi:hypothetical protein